MIDPETGAKLTNAQKEIRLAPIKSFMADHIKGPQLGILLDSMTYQSDDEGSTPSNIPQYNVELLKGGNTTQKEVAEAIARLNHEIARVLGVEHMMLGESHGTQALSKDKNQTFAMIVESTLQELAETYEKDLLDVVWSLNGWDNALKPNMKTEAIQWRDLNQITSGIRDLAQAAALVGPESAAVAEVFDQMGLTRPDMRGMESDSILSPVGGVTEDQDEDTMPEGEEAEETE